MNTNTMSSQGSIQKLVPCHWCWISLGFALKKKNAFYSYSFSLNKLWMFMIHYVVLPFFCSKEGHVPRLKVKALGEVAAGLQWRYFSYLSSGNGSYGSGCIWDFLGKLSWGNHNGGVPLTYPEMVRWWHNRKHNLGVAPW